MESIIRQGVTFKENGKKRRGIGVVWGGGGRIDERFKEDFSILPKSNNAQQEEEKMGMLGKLKKRTHGFTLLELLVVMIIIGLLASVSVPLYRQITLRAATVEAENTIGEIMTAQWLYFQENGTFIADEAQLMVTWDETNFDIVTPFTSTDFALDVTITANGQAGRPAAGETVTGVLTSVGKRTIN